MQIALSIVMTVLALASPATPEKTREQMKASLETHKGDFDYLLGDWEFTAVSQQWGKFRGRWSAVRISDGVILDEYRILGDPGETIYATRTLRAYNAPQDQWELVSTDTGTGLQKLGTAHREGSEMRIEQKFGYGTSNPSTWRIHYYNIGADHFSWAADRSTDNGKTWTKDFQTIEAHRIGAAPTAVWALTKPEK